MMAEMLKALKSKGAVDFPGGRVWFGGEGACSGAPDNWGDTSRSGAEGADSSAWQLAIDVHKEVGFLGGRREDKARYLFSRINASGEVPLLHLPVARTGLSAQFTIGFRTHASAMPDVHTCLPRMRATMFPIHAPLFCSHYWSKTPAPS